MPRSTPAMIRSQASIRPSFVAVRAGQRLGDRGVVAQEGRLEQPGLDQLAEQLEEDLVLLQRRVDLDAVRRGVPEQGLLRRLEGDRLADGLAHRVVHRQPAPLAAEVDGAGRGLDDPRAEGVGHTEVEVADQRPDRGLVAPRLVGLEHRELGGVGGVDALVAEDPAHLVDPVDPADDGLLQVQLEGDAQHHLVVEGVHVGAERAGRGAAVHQLDDGRLDLDVALVLEGLPDGAQRGGLGAHHVAGLLAHDEVGVALAHPALLGQLLVQHRQRAQRLGRHPPAARHHRQLTAARADHPALDEDVVAEVDVGLPRGEGLLAHLGEAEHHLQPGPDALLERGEGELAGVADEDHAAGDADDVLGLLALLEVPPLLAHLLERVGARDRDRVGRDAGGEQAVALVAADPQLLGQVGLGERVGGRLGHEGQAYGHSVRAADAPPVAERVDEPRVAAAVALVDPAVVGQWPPRARPSARVASTSGTGSIRLTAAPGPVGATAP